MAVRFTTGGVSGGGGTADALYRSVSFPSTTTVSASFWFYRIGDTNTFADLLLMRNDGYSAWSLLGMDSDGTTLRHEDANGGTNGLLSVANTWYHCGLSKSGANVTVYIDGTSNITRTNATNPTVTGVTYGGVGNWGQASLGTEIFDGRMAAMKIWDGVALTQAELQQEQWFYMPVRTANLWHWNPLLNIVGDFTVDFSGSGNTFTAGGTLTAEDGPPIAWRMQRSRVWPLAVAAAPGGRTTRNTDPQYLGVNLGMSRWMRTQP